MTLHQLNLHWLQVHVHSNAPYIATAACLKKLNVEGPALLNNEKMVSLAAQTTILLTLLSLFKISFFLPANIIAFLPLVLR